MKTPSRTIQLRCGIAYIITNFASPIVFYLTFHELGAKAAIALALLVTGLQILFHLVRRQKPTLFFKITSVFIVSFGGIDLLISTPRFFRLEPFAQNFLIATLLLVAYIARVPILSRLAAELPEKVRPHSSLPERYYRKITVLLMFYLYVKAGLFLYLAFAVDLGTLILLRSILGGGTLLAMFLGELSFRKKYLARLTAKSKET